MKKKIAVVGAGPAGLSFATIAAQRGHEVSLFEAEKEIGGQFNMAKRVPGKEEFYETLRYYKKQIELQRVQLFLNNKVDFSYLINQDFDEIVLASGVRPRKINIEGIEHSKVFNYIDVLKHKREIGKKVAIIGAGGIGFDVAEYLTQEGESSSLNTSIFLKEWGVDVEYKNRGAIASAKHPPSVREIYILQRSKGKPGKGLGKTTGWIHRSSLKKKNVKMINSVQYQRIDDEGLHFIKDNKEKLLEVDHVIVCAGQEPLRELIEPIKKAGKIVHLIGGADEARELDAKRAIDQGARLAAKI